MKYEWTEKARSINFDRLDQLVSERIAALKNIVHSNEKTGFSDEAMNAICRDLIMPCVYSLGQFIEAVSIEEQTE
jgi:CheY-specific phosphatase CheX